MTGTTGDTALDLLERDRELGEIAAALEDAQRGAGRLLHVEGAAGIGKTRLLGLARELARERGMTTLTARGTELEREFAFGAVRQLFEPELFTATPAAR